MSEKSETTKPKITAVDLAEHARILKQNIREAGQEPEENLSRRYFLAALAGGLIGAVGGLAARDAVRWLTRPGLIPKFDVYIFNKERAEKLPEEKRRLIYRSNFLEGYIAIGFASNDRHAKADIHHNFGSFIGRDVREQYGEVYARRDIALGSEEFTFVANGPEIGNNRVIKVERKFLLDSKLLEKIIEADNLEGEAPWERKEHFPEFRVEFRDYFGYEVPDKCEIQIGGVTYHVDGVEALTGGDRNMFAEFWLVKPKYKDFAAFKEDYEIFGELRKEVEKAGPGEEKIGKILDSFSKRKGQYQDSETFMVAYGNFADAAERIGK